MVEHDFWENKSGKSFHYVRYIPTDYDPNKKYRLVVFMHGAGERGPDDGSKLNLVHRYFWFNRAIESNEEFPFIMVGPQCPDTNYWGAYIESLNSFLDFIIDKYSIDINHIYLTGLSMGGTGSWLWSLANPERFAAVAPVCGSGVCWFGMRLVDKPVWAFHGDLDNIVPPESSLAMVKDINEHGGHAKLTIFHGVEHNAWDYAYAGNTLIDWFMQY